MYLGNELFVQKYGEALTVSATRRAVFPLQNISNTAQKVLAEMKSLLNPSFI